jgi:ABC-type dipeptide/oligopeptide/nickel transport system ATPase component
MLEVIDLNVTYITRRGSARVVQGVNFTVQDGQISGLVGESGSGKSAAIHALARLPRSVRTVVTGSVLLNGRDLLTAAPRDLRRMHGGELGFVGQNPFGCLHPTVQLTKQFHNVLKAHGRTSSRAESRQLAGDSLRAVGIEDPERVLGGYAHQLSGGMAQRTVIAMATVLRPKLLIADEPTTALDPTVQIQILDVLQKLRHEQAMSVLMVTHDLGVVANYCDQALVMKSGRVVEQGPVAMLFESPEHPYTRELFGAGSSSGGAS